MGLVAALLLPCLPLPMLLLGLLGAFALPVAAGAGQRATASSRSGSCCLASPSLGAVRAVAGHRPGQRRPAVQQLLSWMSGSTYYVTQPVALCLVVLALLMLAACFCWRAAG